MLFARLNEHGVLEPASFSGFSFSGCFLCEQDHVLTSFNDGFHECVQKQIVRSE